MTKMGWFVKYRHLDNLFFGWKTTFTGLQGRFTGLFFYKVGNSIFFVIVIKFFFVGTIGGSLGLAMGCSLITFIEFIVFGIQAMYWYCKYKLSDDCTSPQKTNGVQPWKKLLFLLCKRHCGRHCEMNYLVCLW